MKNKVEELINLLDPNTIQCTKCKKFSTAREFSEEFLFREKFHTFKSNSDNRWLCNICWGKVTTYKWPRS